jgi:Flp pilus assembly protein TadG
MKPNITLRFGKEGERGNSLVEVALMAPWIFFLFVLIVDFGFYAYAAICTENAARVAVLATAASDAASNQQTYACIYVKNEMRHLPNYTQFPATCNALPLQVTVTRVAAADDAAQWASRVSVRYQSIPMIPIPGMMGQLTIRRTAEMRVYGL